MMNQCEYPSFPVALFRIFRAYLIGPSNYMGGWKKPFLKRFNQRISARMAWYCASSEIKSFILSCAGYWSREYNVQSDGFVWRHFTKTQECSESAEKLKDMNCKKIFGMFVRNAY